ncbi:MAG: phosphopantetheine-binding [Bacteroidetes bacterium]|uniref:phosphopantetheine-binding protein n=1 Tax=Chitinophaga TaxID=79328 RepID=UPI0009D39D3E|nr:MULTISPECIES: phosphopantetheine-binding protein [Chitinophaga]MBP1650645.1 phosphopantetheine-binding [Bacteroidota bacterium]OMP80422.1 acyl carrier protein [[Flexibacter] sp. ATCC 35208]WPQ65319.1 phosphopantetheine-binding protein [Chitinophaga sancti]WPV69798.1 phosphopantetheine-binding protein [Chitinophaga sp. LS1]
MENLMATLKAQIIEQLNLQEVKPEDIGDDTPLFKDGLGLDSIDALELIVLLQQHYRIRIANPEQGPEIFHSVRSIANFITAHQQQNQ